MSPTQVVPLFDKYIRDLEILFSTPIPRTRDEYRLLLQAEYPEYKHYIEWYLEVNFPVYSKLTSKSFNSIYT
jgi:hypothetical protein